MDDQPIDASADAATVLDEPASPPPALGDESAATSANGSEPSDDAGHRRRWLLPVLLAPIVLVLLASIAWAVDTSSGGVPRNVRLAGRDVGGLSESELDRRVATFAEAFAATPVRIHAGEETYETTASDLGVMVDESRSAKRALDIDADTFILVRPLEWIGSFLVERETPLALQVNDEQLSATIVELEGDTRIPPTEPSIELVDGSFQVVPGVDGRGIDPASLAAQVQIEAALGELGEPLDITIEPGPLPPTGSDDAARAAASEAAELLGEPVEIETPAGVRTIEADVLRSWATLATRADGTVAVELDPARVDPTLRTAFADIEGHPVDATVTLQGGAPIVIADRPGLVCCGDDAAGEILVALLAGRRTVELPLVDAAAERTSEDVAAWKITQAVGGNHAWRDGAPTVGPPGFTTYHDATGARITNIHRIADLVRGVVVPPGGSFSVNAHVGKRTAEKGFVAAGAISNGQHVEEIGGGISQFATTLFNAAYFAGLDIDEYQAHSEWFSRYPRGREATMGYPSPDLRFTNNTPYGVLIWTSYTQTSLTVTLYSSPYATAEQTAISESMAGRCTVVVTTRTRTFPDGHTETDKFRARYRPGEGQSC